MPLPICLIVLISGLILLYFTQRQRTGKAIVAIGTCILILISFVFVPSQMTSHLEYRSSAVVEMEFSQIPKYIVVLGGGHDSDQRLPQNSQLSSSSLSRLVEAMRLHKMLPDSQLIFSGWGGSDPIPNARVMGETAIKLGMDSDSMILVTTPKDTKDEAKIISEIVNTEQFLLVTSAAHMPRSLALFRKQGASPIPAPTDYRYKKGQGFHLGLLFPSSDNIVTARRAMHEYLGLVWAKIRGQI